MGIGKRDTAIFLAAIALTVLGVVRVFYESAVPTAAWGLSFRQEGTAPVGNAGTEQLRQYDAAYIGDTREKVLYLTFDAGYENGSTGKDPGHLESPQGSRRLFPGGQLHRAEP